VVGQSRRHHGYDLWTGFEPATPGSLELRPGAAPDYPALQAGTYAGWLAQRLAQAERFERSFAGLESALFPERACIIGSPPRNRTSLP
jgi:hypothetical protein